VAYGSAIGPGPVRCIRGPPGRVLHDGPELAELAGPEVGEELLHGGEPVGPDREQVPGALAVLRHQAGIVQHLQVPGDGLGGDVQVAGDLLPLWRAAAGLILRMDLTGR
jgi:hypothetical protein